MFKRRLMDEQFFDKEKLRKHFRGETDETEYLCRLFSDDMHDDELNHALKIQWYDLEDEGNMKEKNLDHILHKLNYEINQREALKLSRFSRLNKWFYKAAAILIIPLLVYSGYSFFKSDILKEPASFEIIAPAWSRVQFDLPDGTKGWLNSNSSIRYKDNFSEKREVILNGEAYFDVISKGIAPFKVLASDVVVTVYGTRFNIESYEDDNTIEVTLEEGKIVYYNKELNRLFSMKPNDYIYYDKVTGKLHVDVVQTEKYSSWKDGKLVFRNDPLDIVAKRLERWYNIDVEINGDISNQPMLRATFVDENLEEVLKLLKLSLPIDYKIIEGEKKGDIIQKNKVVISSKTK